GLSGLNARVVRSFTNVLKQSVKDESQFSQVLAELTLNAALTKRANIKVFGEYNRQFGPGLRDADYGLAGARFTWRDLAVYLNVRYVRYQLTPEVDEVEILPGVSYSIGGGLAALVEYNEWERKDPRGVAFPLQARDPNATITGWYAIDRSLNVVLAYS